MSPGSIPRNRFRHPMTSGYDNPVTTRFPAPTDCSKIPALVPAKGERLLCSGWWVESLFPPPPPLPLYPRQSHLQNQRQTDEYCRFFYNNAGYSTSRPIQSKNLTEIDKGNIFWKHESPTVFFTSVVRLALTQTFRCSKILLRFAYPVR